MIRLLQYGHEIERKCDLQFELALVNIKGPKLKKTIIFIRQIRS